jgi:hypothetical protein
MSFHAGMTQFGAIEAPVKVAQQSIDNVRGSRFGAGESRRAHDRPLDCSCRHRERSLTRMECFKLRISMMRMEMFLPWVQAATHISLQVVKMTQQDFTTSELDITRLLPGGLLAKTQSGLRGD